MRHIALGLLFFCGAAFPYGIQITASGGSPIPASYSTGSQSQAVQCSQSNVIEVLNQTSSVLAVSFSRDASSAPSSDFGFVPSGANSGTRYFLTIGNGTYIYIRSAGSAITSGTVQVSCWTEDRRG